MKLLYSSIRGAIYLSRAITWSAGKNQNRIPNKNNITASAAVRSLAYSLLLTVYTLFTFSLSAQEPRKDSGADGLSAIGALAPGDTIPDAVWNIPLELHYFDGKKKTIHFRDLKGKVILLDFWSTGCKSCIEGIPEKELIQEKFPDIFVLLVNSRRNKDTAARIKNRFKVYKELNGYTPLLPTVLNDTLFTSLFDHNVLPSLGWISKNGVFLGISTSAHATDHNIETVIRTGTLRIPSSGIYRNLSRLTASPRVDTVGFRFISAFSQYRPDYLAVYPNVIHVNGHSLFQIGNYDWSFLLSYAFSKELDGLGWSDYVFDPIIEKSVKERIINSSSDANIFWYQLYTSDSLSESRAQEIFRQDFIRNFSIGVIRKNENIEAYTVKLSDKINRIRTRGGMRITRIQGIKDDVYYQNVPIGLVLRNLFCLVDKPISYEGIEQLHVDLLIPAGIWHLSEDDKLKFLEDKGIVLSRTNQTMEFAYIHPTK